MGIFIKLFAVSHAILLCLPRKIVSKIHIVRRCSVGWFSLVVEMRRAAELREIKSKSTLGARDSGETSPRTAVPQHLSCAASFFTLVIIYLMSASSLDWKLFEATF